MTCWLKKEKESEYFLDGYAWSDETSEVALKDSGGKNFMQWM